MPERRKGERRNVERRVARARLEVTRQEIVSEARNFQWNLPMPSWTTVVGGRELPVRELVLKAARVAENNPTDAGEAAVILSDLGFEVRYKGVIIPDEDLPD